MDRGKEFSVVQIDLSAVPDHVSHSGFLFKLCDVGVSYAAFDFIAGFLSGGVQKLVVDCVRSENVRAVYGVPRGSVLGPLFFCCTSDPPMILENTLVGYDTSRMIFQT